MVLIIIKNYNDNKQIISKVIIVVIIIIIIIIIVIIVMIIRSQFNFRLIQLRWVIFF